MNSSVSRGALQKRNYVLRVVPGHNSDSRCIGGFVAEGDTQSERQQQREYEYPEDDFRFALELEHARRQQVGIAGPAAIAAWRRRHLSGGDRCFLGDAHRYLRPDSRGRVRVVPYGIRLLPHSYPRHGRAGLSHSAAPRLDQRACGFHLSKNSSRTSGVNRRASSTSPFFWLNTSLPSLSATAIAGTPLSSGMSYCFTRSAFLCSSGPKSTWTSS